MAFDFKVNSNGLALAAIAGITVAYLLYEAQNQTGDKPIAQVQSKEDVVGIVGGQSVSITKGMPLDVSVETHFWTPGYDDCTNPQPTVQPRHRYPAIPGGNISTLIHKGYGAFLTDSPSGNDWRITPPEAAVL